MTCQLLAHGHDDLYRVVAGSDKFVLRVYAKGTHSEDLETQANVLAKMIDGGIRAVQPVCSDSGYVLDVPAPEGMRHALLYMHAAGTPIGRGIAPDQARAYGELVARVHNLADAQDMVVPLRIDLAYLVDEPLRIIQPVLAHRPYDFRQLEEFGERLKRTVCALPLTKPAFGLCHGDLHKANVLSDSHGQLTLIDWDCVGIGWRAYDLAILRWSIGLAVGPDGIGEPRLSEMWRAYLEGHQRVRPLTSEELMAIPYFVAIRHIRVMGWEVDRAVNGIAGVGLLTDAYFDWWLGLLGSKKEYFHE